MKKLTLLMALSILLVPMIVMGKTESLPTVELLQKLIRINTTNPPGNETKAARFVQNYLKGFDIDSQIIESALGRGNLIARIKGSGKLEPVLLLAHLDVVTADPEEWTHLPFEATIDGGYLYGRGAIDMKGMASMMINAFVHLKIDQVPLSGDVLLVLVADEEAGGKYGTSFLVKEHWDLIKSRLVMGEGSIGLIKDGLHVYPIQVAEKGVAWLKLSATGTSGHGSMPIPDNATATLIKALDKLIKKKQPIQKTAIARAFLDRLSSHFPFPKSYFMKHFFDFPVRQAAPMFAGSKIEADKIFNAMVRNTVVPTVLKAGSKTNVIPAKAVAEVDCRILPGETPEGFKEKMEKQINDPKVQLDLIMASKPNESDFQTPEFDDLEASILAQDQNGVVVPFISPGATDNRFFREKGILAYGIIPLLITMEDLKGLHGKDERIPIKELAKGEKIIFEFVKRVQGQ